MTTRITGGQWRGRQITTPQVKTTRPTRAVVREALFNILGHRVLEAAVLDLFAGSGAVGFEALSRGAASAIFVDDSQAAITAILDTAARLGCAPAITAVQSEVSTWLQRGSELAALDICFVDAPYQDELLEAVLERIGRTPPRLLVCEHHRRRELTSAYGKMVWKQSRRYGISNLTFYEAE